MNRIPFGKAHTYAIKCHYANDYYYVFSCVQTMEIIRCDCANPNDFNVIIVVIGDAMLSNVFHMASTLTLRTAFQQCATVCEHNHAIRLPIFINQIHKAHLLVKYSKFYRCAAVTAVASSHCGQRERERAACSTINNQFIRTALLLL